MLLLVLLLYTDSDILLYRKVLITFFVFFIIQPALSA